jgi:hypothetical protein
MPQRESTVLARRRLSRRVTAPRLRFFVDRPHILRYISALIALACGDAHLTVTSY